MKKLWLIVPFALLLLIGYRFTQLDLSNNELARVIDPVRVQYQEVTPKALTRWIFSEGIVQAQRKAFLDFEFSGKVVAIGQKEDGTLLREGARVFGPADGAQHGQLLAQIDDRDNTSVVTSLEARLQSMQAQRGEAIARLEQANNEYRLSSQNFARMKEVFKKNVISQDEFDSIQTRYLNTKANIKVAESGLIAVESQIESLIADLNGATIQLEKTSLFSPFDGVITAMNINKDNYYYPPMSGASDREKESRSAIVVVDDNQLEIQLEVGGNEAHQLKEGELVYLAADDHLLYAAEKVAFDHPEIVQGVVWSVSPSINLQRRAQTVKIHVAQNNGRLKEGQFVRAWIVAEQRDQVITLPLHALSYKNSQPFAFVAETDHKVVLRQLTLGQAGLNEIEVISGIDAGDKVIVRGQHLLIDGSEITLLESTDQQGATGDE